MRDQRHPASFAAPGFRVIAGWFAVICVVTLAAYWPSFSVPFQFDDYGHIVENEAIRGHNLGEFLRFGRTRILPFSTLALSYWMGGEETFGYHVGNFLVHVLATLAVYALALTLCRTPRLRDTWLAEHRLAFAVAAAFVFACHPLQVQAVTYIVQRISAMAALFYVGSVFCYVRARNADLDIEPGNPRLWYAGTGLCAVAALLSKENAASLPVALLLTEWIFYRGRTSRQSVRRIALVAGFVVLLPLTWWLLPQPSAPAPQQAESSATEAQTAPSQPSLLWSIRAMLFRAEGSGRVSSLQYLMTQCIVIPRYLRMAVAPYGFNVDHDVRIVGEPTASVLAGAALLLTLLAFGLAASSHLPVISYGILWIFLALSVESSVLPIRDPMVEHRMYLAMPGIALMAALAFAWLTSRVSLVATLVGVAVVGALATATFMRNQVWLTPVALWGDAVEKAPDKARPHVNLATALHHGGRTEQAIAHYCWALRLDPTNQQAKSNLNAISDQQVEKEMDSGEAFVLGGIPGADGTVELEPRDPCAGR